jgi:AGZA family xanthine/uracil permease-like MFS transporter
MSYILVVHPQILSAAGLPFAGVLFATCICSAVATLFMGLVARYPIALAPGMGLNAYFALVVVPLIAKTSGMDQARAASAALGCVFISGALFVLLSLFKVREALIRAVPGSLKMAIAAGIGLFIALIGFQQGGLIADHPVTLVTIGDLQQPGALLTIGGLLLTAGLLARGFRSAVLWGMVAVTLAAIPLGLTELPARPIAWPDPSGTLLRLDLAGAFKAGLLNVIFAFFFVDLFDTLGTLIGVAEQGGLLTPDGELPRAKRALLADACGTLLGALLGTSTVTSYIESAAGIAAGARTGLASVVVALLFLSALLFAPVFEIVPRVATAPVLILVGALMITNVKKIDWSDLSEAAPAFLTIAAIAFTFSIADGIAFGFIAHVVVKGLAGRAREVSPVAWVLALVFVARYALLPH